jgi:hypothetical protein
VAAASRPGDSSRDGSDAVLLAGQNRRFKLENTRFLAKFSRLWHCGEAAMRKRCVHLPTSPLANPHQPSKRRASVKPQSRDFSGVSPWRLALAMWSTARCCANGAPFLGLCQDPLLGLVLGLAARRRAGYLSKTAGAGVPAQNWLSLRRWDEHVAARGSDSGAAWRL